MVRRPEIYTCLTPRYIYFLDGYQRHHNLPHSSSFVALCKSHGMKSLKDGEILDLLKTCFPLIKIQLNKGNENCVDTPTTANFIGDAQTWAMLKDRSPIDQQNMQLDFNSNEDSIKRPNCLPIRNTIPNTFDWYEYLKHLKTDALGRSIIHCNSITSTFDITQGKFLKSGLAVVADQQTSGTGRSGNKWLSPKGKNWDRSN